MKRVILAIAALLLIVLTVNALSGCTAMQSSAPANESQSAGDAPSSESAAPTPTQPAALPKPEIKFTEGVPQALFDSPAYKAALENAAVIAYNGKVLTTSNAVRAFLDTVENGGSAALYYYAFTYMEDWQEAYGEGTTIEEAAPWRIYAEEITAENGKLSERQFLQYSWEEPFAWSEYRYAIDELFLSDWGALCQKGESSSELLGHSVVSGYELWDDYAERMEIERRYFRPIYYDILNEFDVSGGSLAGWAWYFNDIYVYEDPDDNGGNLWALYPDSMIPRTLIADTISRYFDIPYDRMLGIIAIDRDYRPEKDAVEYGGGRGGLGPSPRVRYWSQEGDRLLITFDDCDYITGEPQRGFTMTVRLLEDGSFRYQSNRALVTE